MLNSKNYKVIIGLGETGLSVARFLAMKNEPFVVMDTRAAPQLLPRFQAEFPEAEVFLQNWPQQVLNDASALIVSPGISIHVLPIQLAKNQGVEIIGDVELFARYQNAPIIAITGSNGKSTVTTLVGEMAKACHERAVVIGNIGEPVLNTLIRNDNPDINVMELSSFQLETTYSLKPVAATILNISPDHLDRYESMDAYIKAKQRIYFDANFVIINKQDPFTFLPEKNKDKKIIYFTLETPLEGEFGLRNIANETWLCFGQEPWVRESELQIFGRHNMANALAALALGYAAGFEQQKMLQVLRRFRGLTHRCELVTEKDNIQWINDSKGTNIGATQAAIEGIGPHLKGQIILLLGGDGKGADFSTMRESVSRYCREILVMGKDAHIIADALSPRFQSHHVNTMYEAVGLANTLAKPGDCVLLSPACSSLDQYQNFEHRGDVFKECVLGIDVHRDEGTKRSM